MAALSPEQLETLKAVESCVLLTPEGLGEICELTGDTARHRLRNLRASGHLEVERNPESRRVVYKLAPLGRSALQEAGGADD